MDEFIADAIKLFLVVLLVLLNGFFCGSGICCGENQKLPY